MPRRLSRPLSLTAFAMLVVACFALPGLLQPVAAVPVMTDGAELGKWTMDMDAATALAKEKKLPMLLNFTGSDWCYWCKLMDNGVFAKDDWTAYARENLVLVTIDFPRDETIVPEKYKQRNTQLGEKYSIRGYPTYLLVSSDGSEVYGKLGAKRDPTPAWFIREIRQTLRRNSEAGRQAYLGQLTEAQAKDYVANLEALKKAEAAMEQFIASEPADSPETLKQGLALQAAVEQASGALRQIEVDHLASALPAEKAAQLKAAYEAVKVAEKTLNDWLATQPEQNEENLAKFRQMMEQVQTAEAKVQAFE